MIIINSSSCGSSSCGYTNLQPGANIFVIHALHLCFIMKLIHHTVHQIHQGLDEIGVRGRRQLLKWGEKTHKLQREKKLCQITLKS